MRDASLCGPARTRAGSASQASARRPRPQSQQFGRSPGAGSVWNPAPCLAAERKYARGAENRRVAQDRSVAQACHRCGHPGDMSATCCIKCVAPRMARTDAGRMVPGSAIGGGRGGERAGWRRLDASAAACAHSSSGVST
eukprot:364274-Chlamydomonas_euryale.AAC.1